MKLLKDSLGNAIRNILRNKIINFLCFSIIAFTLFIFGIFNYINFSLEKFTSKFSRNIKAIFYLKDDVSQNNIDILIEKIKQSLLIKEISFKSKHQAEVDFSRQFPQLNHILAEFKESPFPSSIEVNFKEENAISIQVLSFIEEIEKLAIIDSKEVNTEWAKKILTLKKFISVVGGFLSLILIFVSFFIIFNVIKLNIIFRRDEINVYRLVGATDWYIRFPFIIEGALLGFFGSIMASLLLLLLLKLFPANPDFMFEILKDMINFKDIPLAIFIKLVVMGTLIGLFSSLFSIRKFMKN